MTFLFNSHTSRGAVFAKGVTCHHGEAGLDAAPAANDILICLMPLGFPECRALWEPAGRRRADRCARQRAHVARYDRRHRSGAPDLGDPFRSHAKIILTSHVASVTQPATAAWAVIENIRRHQAGLDPIGLVDRARGY